MIEPTIAAGQWRLAEVQLANWGTFDGAITRIPIARKGHLITGPSGSGKSSLLDAIAVVMTPDKWLKLNQAAQGSRVRTDQRNIPSYLRGAWSRTVDDDEDRVVSALLRRGATWSAIVLRFENGVDAPVSLCRVFFMKGTATSNADVNDLCLIDRSVVDIRDLEPYVRSGIETRKVQAAWPNGLVTSNAKHAPFYARLRSIFGIANETALQLLHKTQSAKNLDSLDQLFRESMLEEPATFAIAKTAVEQFGELRDAHDRVVQLRLQRDHLQKLRSAAERYDAAVADGERTLRRLDALEPFQQRRVLELATAERDESAEDITRLTAAALAADAEQQRATDAVTTAVLTANQLGGDDAERLTRDLRAARDAEQAVTLRRDDFAGKLAAVGITGAVSTAAEFAELMAAIDRQLRDEQRSNGPTWEQQDRLSKAKEALRVIDAQITSVRTSGSTVSSDLLRVRAAVADELGLPPAALPFAAELLEVRPEFAEWTGAIERVLRPLAFTMLVRSEHLGAVRRFVDGRRIHARLVFEEVTAAGPPPRPVSDQRSLVHRVTVSDGAFQWWLAGQLSERFDVVCVDRPDELDDHLRAVTINGQVKTSRHRYEKDDRVEIDDRSHWVLGDREGKLEALAESRRLAALEVDEADEIVSRIATAAKTADQQRGGLVFVREQRWSEIDLAPAIAAVASLQAKLDELTRDDGDLRDALARVESARAASATAIQLRDDAQAVLRRAQEAFDDAAAVAAQLESEIAAGRVAEVAEHLSVELDERFRSIQRSITRANIAGLGQQVQRQLVRERDEANSLVGTASEQISTLAVQFNERWEAAAVDLTPTVADRGAYLELLDDILADDLPAYEARFMQLLRDRSRDLIGELVSDIQGAPREIAERVEPVNASLRRSRFDEGRFLRLRVKVKRSDTVTRFIADLKSVSEGSWGDEDRDAAERRFVTLADLMRRLGSSEHLDRVWRTQCLDTRLHVTFLAEEIDEHERVHATYDSGAAMSGGQQQKLVVFCLAAALRYQLADPDEAVSRFGTIVLDEAFDKADTRYTRMALDVFVEFGFQMVLATPQKLLQTIEPYVGGATAVENPDRKRSRVSQVQWERDR